jgi:hypothetical protein
VIVLSSAVHASGVNVQSPPVPPVELDELEVVVLAPAVPPEVSGQ